MSTGYVGSSEGWESFRKKRKIVHDKSTGAAWKKLMVSLRVQNTEVKSCMNSVMENTQILLPMEGGNGNFVP